MKQLNYYSYVLNVCAVIGKYQPSDVEQGEVYIYSETCLPIKEQSVIHFKYLQP